MNILRRHLLGGLAALGLLVACGDATQPEGGAEPAPERVTINLTGSSTVAPLALELGKRFEEQNPGVRVDVQTGGSSRGLNDARAGVVDLGMMSRGLKEGEEDVKAWAIANDGICLILNSANPIASLEREQVIGIYTGAINDWSEVGGAAGPITVVNKAEGRSTLELFLSHYKLENSQVQADVVIGDNEQGVKTVAGNPGAIGYVSIGTAEYSATHDVPIKLLPVGGVAPTVDNVANGTFPLSRPLNLVAKAEPTGKVKEFLDFARAPEQHDLVEQLHFVPLR